MERIAKVAQIYSGRNIAPGERFNVEPQDINLLLLLNRIELGEPETEKEKEIPADAGGESPLAEVVEDRQLTVDQYKNRAIKGKQHRGGRGL